MQGLVRMRTIPKLVQEMKKADPETPINEHFIRKLVKSGKIPFVSVNRRVLIPLDTFEKILSEGAILAQYSPLPPKGIQRIEE